MVGWVLSYRENEDVAAGWIADENDDWYQAPRKVIVPDSIGRRFLLEGEPVTFEYATRIKNGKTVRDATVVHRANADMSIDLATHREACLVTERKFLLRQLGGLLRVSVQDKQRLRPGWVVECSVKDDGFPTWAAVDIKFMHATEGEWLAAEEVVDGR